MDSGQPDFRLSHFFQEKLRGKKKSDFMCNPSFFKVVKKFEF